MLHSVKFTGRNGKDFFDINCVILWIESNLTNDISTKDITVFSGYSHSHMQHKFRRITGVSIWNYIINRRLTMAALDLRFTKLSLVEISLKYFWASQQSFSRAFKYRFGIAPAKWRKVDSVSSEKYVLPMIVSGKKK